MGYEVARDLPTFRHNHNLLVSCVLGKFHAPSSEEHTPLLYEGKGLSQTLFSELLLFTSFDKDRHTLLTAHQVILLTLCQYF